MNLLKLSITTSLLTLFTLLSGCNVQTQKKDAQEQDGNTQDTTALDSSLRAQLLDFDLISVTQIEVVNDITLLGERLFSDKNLSGNRDISCETCHQLDTSTEQISLSLGTGATGENLNRTQEEGIIIKRNAPHLFNIAQNEVMFLDGRVSFEDGTWSLPLTLSSTTLSQFDKALDAQTLFPLISPQEMLGQPDQNDIAKLGATTAALDAILKDRILNDTEYTTAFARAFPAAEEFNTGHLGHALGEFIENKFLVRDTPYDRYLQGDNSAINTSAKRGFLVFIGKGQCIRCHSGKNLTDNRFHSVGVPHIFDSSNPTDDLGQYEATVSDGDQYLFKTPGLRNISRTGPYMHNGAFSTLSQVIVHYNNISLSLSNYSIPAVINAPYSTPLTVDRNNARNSIRFNQMPIEELKNGLLLNNTERIDLEEFLKTLSN